MHAGMWFHITTFFSANETGPALALVATSTALSQVIGAPIGAALMLMDGLRGIRGWKWLFLIEGLITMVFGIAFYVSRIETCTDSPETSQEPADFGSNDSPAIHE